MKAEDLADFCASMTCECCGNEPGVGVASITGIPMSIMWGRKCLDAGVVPMWAAVANTALAGPLETTAAWWQDIVERTVAYFDVTPEWFAAEVARCEADQPCALCGGAPRSCEAGDGTRHHDDDRAPVRDLRGAAGPAPLVAADLVRTPATAVLPTGRDVSLPAPVRPADRGEAVSPLPGKPCHLCGHPFDSHKLVAPTGDPMDGGCTLCPVRGCQCYATWSPRHPDLPEVPPMVLDAGLIAEMREWVQAP